MAEFAYAMVRGIHSVNTLAANTDEGSLVFDMLRGSSVSKATGFFTWGTSRFKNHLLFHPKSRKQLGAVIDSLVLITGGLVAVSDPGCIGEDNKLYPTILRANVARNSESLATTQRDNIARVSVQFFKNWIENIVHALGYSGGPSDKMIENFAASALAIKERHAKHETILPWFWVEPTSIITRSDYIVCPLQDIHNAGLADYKHDESYYYTIEDHHFGHNLLSKNLSKRLSKLVGASRSGDISPDLAIESPTLPELIDNPISISCSTPSYVGLYPFGKVPRSVYRQWKISEQVTCS